MKRSGPLKRSGRLAPASAKTFEKQRARRQFVAAFKKAHPFCEARVTAVCRAVRLPTTDVHEVWTRARGGPIDDERACKGVCRGCHDWIHQNPEMARVRGLLVSAAKGSAWLERGGVNQ